MSYNGKPLSPPAPPAERPAPLCAVTIHIHVGAHQLADALDSAARWFGPPAESTQRAVRDWQEGAGRGRRGAA